MAQPVSTSDIESPNRSESSCCTVRLPSRHTPTSRVTIATTLGPNAPVGTPGGRRPRVTYPGSDTTPGAWPNVVLLDSGCTGVAVSRDVVLFAAHCGKPTLAWFGEEFHVDGAPQDGFSMVPKKNAYSVPLSGCRFLSDGKLAVGNDLGFCLLEEPLDPRSVAPLAAGCEREFAFEGSLVTLVGFGVAQEGGEVGSMRQLSQLIPHRWAHQQA